MKTLRPIFILLVLFLNLACNKQIDENENTAALQAKEREAMIEANKYLVIKDAELIEKYVERRGLEMKKSRSGLWYAIVGEANEQKAAPNKVVKLSYTVHLLDGTFCYEGDARNAKEFLIGKSQVEHGLEEGVLMMCVGNKAKFIIPPHLAFGLIGDQNKIPARAILVYDVELLSVADYQ